MSNPAFESFVAPARNKSELWRTALGLLVGLILYALGAWAVIVGGGLILADVLSPDDIVRGSTPPGVLLLLFHFIAMAAAVALITRFIHKRPVRSLFGDTARLMPDFLSMAGLCLAIAVLASVIIVIFVDVDWTISLGTWLLFLPLALPLILLQTGAEEMVFRGYLQQQLGARFGTGAYAAWMIVPAVLFALGHSDPTSQGANVWAVFAITFFFSLITADVTARSGSLGAAWGLHFVNNVQALLLFSLTGPLNGLSLGSIGISPSSPSALPLFAGDALALCLIYLLWRRRHG
ncbi:MAG: type II CAAX endopeptidase family protein [Pseudomonadota bacterium]